MMDISFSETVRYRVICSAVSDGTSFHQTGGRGGSGRVTIPAVYMTVAAANCSRSNVTDTRDRVTCCAAMICRL